MAISDISINNILIAREVASSGSLKLEGDREKFKKRYDEKQAEIARRNSRSIESAETGAFLTDAANNASGSARGVSPVMTSSSLTLPGPPPYEVGTNEVNEGERLSIGKYVSSLEELEYDMGSATRDISEIIIHWSETFSNANLTGKQLQQLTGSGNNNYHYIIKRDGSVERGVPLKSPGNHTPGHNSYSIGVCLIGGVAAATEDQGLNERKSASNITRSQYNTLYQIMRVFFTQYPGGQALGHSEIDGDQDDPGFEVRDYVYNLFNKSSLFVDPENESEKSPNDVLAAVDAEGPNVIDTDTEILDQKF
jgi:hypothetical protein